MAEENNTSEPAYGSRVYGLMKKTLSEEQFSLSEEEFNKKMEEDEYSSKVYGLMKKTLSEKQFALSEEEFNERIRVKKKEKDEITEPTSDSGQQTGESGLQSPDPVEEVPVEEPAPLEPLVPTAMGGEAPEQKQGLAALEVPGGGIEDAAAPGYENFLNTDGEPLQIPEKKKYSDNEVLKAMETHAAEGNKLKEAAAAWERGEISGDELEEQTGIMAKKEEADTEYWKNKVEDLQYVDELTMKDKMTDVMKNPAQLVPYIAGLNEMNELYELYGAAERLAAGEETEKDIYMLKYFTDHAQKAKSFGHDVAEGLAVLPSFAGELATSGGSFSVGKKITEKGIKMGLKKLLTKSSFEAIEKKFKALGKKELKKMTKKELLQSGAAKVPGAVAGSVTQAPVAGVTRIGAETIREMLPEMHFSKDEEGELEAWIAEGGEGKDFDEALWKSAKNQWAEVFSEKTGGAVKHIPGIPMPKKLEELKTWLFAFIAKANPDKSPSDLMKFAKKAGWNGILTEMGEERVGDFVRYGIGVEDEWKMPTLRQMAVEGVTFGLPGSALGVANTMLEKPTGTKEKTDVSKTKPIPKKQEPVVPAKEPVEQPEGEQKAEEPKEEPVAEKPESEEALPEKEDVETSKPYTNGTEKKFGRVYEDGKWKEVSRKQFEAFEAKNDPKDPPEAGGAGAVVIEGNAEIVPENFEEEERKNLNEPTVVETTEEFPDSKVKEVVYHGSPDKISEFSDQDKQTNPSNLEKTGSLGKGFYFEPIKENAARWGGGAGTNLYSVALDIKNPYYSKNGEKAPNDSYDATILLGPNGTTEEIMVKDNSQIKILDPKREKTTDAPKAETKEAPVTKPVQEVETGPIKKVKTKTGLAGVIKNIFGIKNKKMSSAAAEIGDKMVGRMADLAGISKKEMYDNISFTKGNKKTTEQLKEGKKAKFQGKEGDKNFEEWSGGANVMTEDQVAYDSKTGEPGVFRVYHGTTNSFYEFDSGKKGEPGGHFGAINYFTSDYSDANSNYAGEGPDLTQRIDMRGEGISQQIEDEYSDEQGQPDMAAINEEFGFEKDELNDDASFDEIGRAIASRQLKGNEEKVMDLYVKLNNPVVVGREGSWTEDITEDMYEHNLESAAEEVAEENDITVEEAKEDFDYDIKQRAIESSGIWESPLLDAVQKALDENGVRMDAHEAVGDMEIMEYDLNELEASLRHNIGEQEAEAGQIVADIFKALGYDGIIMANPAKRFPGMGINEGTSHVHVFDQYANQIKNADGSNVEFGETADIRFQEERGAVLMEDAKALIFALTNADITTPLHELAHVYEKFLTETEKADILKWAGHKTWTNETSEFFAQGFEQYLKDGKAPNAKMKDIFDQFAEWLSDMIVGLPDGMTLNKPMQDIYADMLGEGKTAEKKESKAGKQGVLFQPKKKDPLEDPKKFEEWKDKKSKPVELMGIQLIGLSNAMVKKDILEKVGSERGKVKMANVFEEGREAFESGELKPADIVDKINSDETAVLTAKEYAALVYAKAALNVQIDNLEREADIAEEEGHGVIASSKRARAAVLDEQINLLDEASTKAGARQAVDFSARAQFIDSQYNLHRLKRNLKKEIKDLGNGAEATKGDLAKLEVLHAKWKAVSRELERLKEGDAFDDYSEIRNAILKDLGATESEASEAPSKKDNKSVSEYIDSLADSMEDSLSELDDMTFADFGFVASIKLGMKAGIKVMRLTADTARAIEAMVEEIQKTDWYNSLSDTDKKKAERRAEEIFNQKLAASRDKYVEKRGDILNFANDDLKKIIKDKNIRSIEELVEAILELDDYKELDARVVRDAITGYKSTPAKTKVDVAARNLQDMKKIGILLSQLQDAQKGILRTDSKYIKEAPLKKVAELRREIDAIVAANPNLRPHTVQGSKEWKALDAKVQASIQAEIDQLNEDIIADLKRTEAPTTAESINTTLKRQEKKMLEARLKAMQDAKNPEAAIARHLEMLAKRANTLQSQIDNPESIKLPPELQALAQEKTKEVKEAEKLITDLQKQKNVILGKVSKAKPKPTAAEKESRAAENELKRLDKELAALNDKLAKNDLSTKPKGKDRFANNKAVQAKKAEVAAARKRLSDARRKAAQEAKAKELAKQPQLTAEEKAEQAELKRLDREIAKVKERIEKEDYERIRTHDKFAKNELVQKKKEEVKAIKEKFKQGKIDSGVAAKEWNDDYQKRVDKRMKEMKSEIKRAEAAIKKKEPFEPKKKVPVTYVKNKKTRDKLHEKMRLERDLKRVVELAKIAAQTGRQKNWKRLQEVVNLSKTGATMLDFSAPFRQGIIYALNHPIRTFIRKKDRALHGKTPFTEMFKQAWNPKTAEEWLLDLQASAEWDILQKAELYISDPTDPNVQAREEDYAGNWARLYSSALEKAGEKVGKIPGVGGILKAALKILDVPGWSERSYIGFLNQMRYDNFMLIAKRMEKLGVDIDTPEGLKAYKVWANFINNGTGRGDLNIGKQSFEKASKVLAMTFFSPRLLSARHSTMIPFVSNPMKWSRYYRDGKMPKGGMNLSHRAALEMLRFYITAVGVGLTITFIAKLLYEGDDDDDEFIKFEADPRNTDFGKVKIGDMRVDFLGGYAQFFRAYTQIATGEVKGKDAEIYDLTTKGRTRRDVLIDFVSGKFAPALSQIAKASLSKPRSEYYPGEDVPYFDLNRETFFGEEYNMLDELGKAHLPLGGVGMYETYAESDIQNWQEGLATVLQAIATPFGVGFQKYGADGIQALQDHTMKLVIDDAMSDNPNPEKQAFYIDQFQSLVVSGVEPTKKLLKDELFPKYTMWAAEVSTLKFQKQWHLDQVEAGEYEPDPEYIEEIDIKIAAIREQQEANVDEWREIQKKAQEVLEEDMRNVRNTARKYQLDNRTGDARSHIPFVNNWDDWWEKE